MKFFAVFVLVIIAVVAEPQASGPVFIARYSAAPQQQAPVVPYPMGGIQPQLYALAPQQVPQTVNNPPQPNTTEFDGKSNSTQDLQGHAPVVPYPMGGIRAQLYVLARQQVPQTVYNPPQASTTESDEKFNSTQDSIETTTEPQSDKIQQNKKTEDKKNEKLLENAQGEDVEQGVYYLYHPSGVLQRVAYATSNDVRNMAYVAQLNYQNVDPIREPIYTYDPETFLLQKVSV